MGDVVVRDLLPRDVPSYCALLAGVFEQEYGEQGLDIKSFERLYKVVALANLILRPLRLDFFRVTVAVEDGKVVGSVTTFKACRKGWYQGFGSMDKSQRGKGLYKTIVRHGLAGAGARGGLVGGGEINPVNEPALAPYRDKFGTTIFPARKVYVAKPGEIADPTQPVPLERLSARRFEALPEAREIQPQFRGGFLLEQEPRRSLLGALAAWQLPPLTAEPWAWIEAGKLKAFARVRTHWPAMIRSLDALYFAPELSGQEVRQALLSVLRLYKHKTKLNVRVYVDEGRDLLESVCQELGFELLAPLCPIRTNIPLALSRTDESGRLLDKVTPEARA